MNPMKSAPVALCLALGACASVPPSGPTVSAVAGPKVSDQKFARDDDACRARAYSATEQAAAVAGQLGLQNQYDSVYSACMQERGYAIERVARYYYGPGPYYYGPGPYAYGPAFYYGWGWGGGWAWGHRW